MQTCLSTLLFALLTSAQLTPVPSEAIASAVVVIGGAIQAGTNGTSTFSPPISATTSASQEDASKAMDAVIGGIRAGVSNPSSTGAVVTTSPTTTLSTSTSTPAAASQATGNNQGMLGAAPKSGVQHAGLAAAIAVGALAFVV
ncbi:Hypothetical protein D9617_4g000460 [Elsinoe fawcettii]|nr:Hypothetical protein D9617_4g000460 [Elsinoe fawcettii]